MTVPSVTRIVRGVKQKFDSKKTLRLFGLMVRQERRRCGWSLDEAVKVAKVSKGTLSRIERGVSNPGLITACRIANALGVTVQDLIS